VHGLEYDLARRSSLEPGRRRSCRAAVRAGPGTRARREGAGPRLAPFEPLRPPHDGPSARAPPTPYFLGFAFWMILSTSLCFSRRAISRRTFLSRATSAPASIRSVTISS